MGYWAFIAGDADTPALLFTPHRKGTQRLQVSSSRAQKLPQVCSWQGPLCTELRRSVQNSPDWGKDGDVLLALINLDAYIHK